MKFCRPMAVALLLAACHLSAGNPPVPQRADLGATAAARAEAATVALFVNSNLDSARTLAAAALRQDPAQKDALFVEMEAAALAADTAAELQAALRICELSSGQDDPRAIIAAARIEDRAGNTLLFREAIPRIRKLLAAGGAPAHSLRAALVAAAGDGVSSLAQLDLARESGLVTDWRVAGPFGKYSNLAFDRTFPPEHDNLAAPNYDGRAVEEFRFYDGNFSLPDYFSSTGVFYAAARLDITEAGEYELQAESGGTLAITLDGSSQIVKDDRWKVTPATTSAKVQLQPGTHQLLVKFLASAAPFRVTIVPASRNSTATPGKPAATARSGALPQAEARYLQATLPFWMGDYSAAIAQLTALRRDQDSAGAAYLLAQAWEISADESPEALALLESSLKQAPLALAAEYELTARAYDSGNPEEAFARARRVVNAHPEFVAAQHLLAESAARLRAHAEAGTAFEAELRLHPSCAALRSAQRFWESRSAYARASAAVSRLEGCAPGSLAYAETLAEAGRHSEAAQAAGRVSTARPLDRSARELLVRELAAAGDHDAAVLAARQLVALAPQSLPYRRLAEDVAAASPVFDPAPGKSTGFAEANEFYAQYRRNGLEVIRKTTGRRFSGGPILTVLQDRVVQLGQDGSVSLYSHTITRVLDRGGIERYGEVTIPPDADLLELRTIKADGTIVEPEFAAHKKSISMPALAPGDAIEEEYVLRYPDGGLDQHAGLFRLTFGSFNAPLLYIRLVTITPPSVTPEIITSGEVPDMKESRSGAATVRVWEDQDIAQSTQEISTVKDALPTVRLVPRRSGGWRDLQQYYADELITAVRIGPRVEQTARAQAGNTPEETARRIYRLVTTRLRSIDGSLDEGEITPAESTLADYAGNRTATLLALSRAAGLQTDVLLARDRDVPRPKLPVRGVYVHPLVRFRFGDRVTVVDAQADNTSFGVLPPDIAHEDALPVKVGPDSHGESSTAETATVLVPVPPSAGEEHSSAEGEVTFDPQGDMMSRITIRMGASRGAQMRNTLSGTSPAERPRLLEQIAMRIFPGGGNTTGGVRNENDPDLPLELELSSRTAHFLSFNGNTADLEQLAPALGLRKMYGLGTRHFPLYIDMPLVETTVFHIHLPPGAEAPDPLPELHLENEFGAYTLQVRRVNARQIDVRRAFRIPVQVIAPERFEAFAQFERQIDEAERRRITLVRRSGSASTVSRFSFPVSR